MAGSDEWRCAAATVPPGHSATFRLERAGRTVNAFVVNHDGHYRVRELLPTSALPGLNEFFGGRRATCSTHGALEPIGRRSLHSRRGDRLTATAGARGATLVVRWPAGRSREWSSVAAVSKRTTSLAFALDLGWSSRWSR
jgi:hypothetical protein